MTGKRTSKDEACGGNAQAGVTLLIHHRHNRETNLHSFDLAEKHPEAETQTTWNYLIGVSGKVERRRDTVGRIAPADKDRVNSGDVGVRIGSSHDIALCSLPQYFIGRDAHLKTYEPSKLDEIT